MRNFISCAIASVLLIAATGVRAQVPGVAAGAGDGGVAGGVRAEGARAVPTVTMDTDESQPVNEAFTVNFRFSENVTDFDIDDISVTNGSEGLSVRGSGRRYTVEVTPDSDLQDPDVVTVTVRANAVESVSTDQGNRRTIQTFQVDTRAPELDDAEVDEDELVLTYDEDLDEDSEPAGNDFQVSIDGSDVVVFRATVLGSKVTLDLRDPASKDDVVRLDYTPPSNNPIQDLAGNAAESFTRKRVTNNTLTGDDLPSAPRNLDATADGRTRIDLEWDAPTDDGGSTIIGYRIQSSDTRSGGWDDLVDDTEDDDTEYTDTGLTAGTTQYYRVAAINREGDGPWSDIADATTDGGEPSAPLNLTATESGQSRIDLSWDEPTYDGGGITGYLIEVSTNRGSSWSDLEVNTRSTSTTYSHTGLTGGTRRHYRVSAINSAGTGDVSNVASATTDIGPPSAPVSLSADARSESRIQLSWGPPTDDGGARITGYKIDVSLTGGTVWTTLIANTRSTSMTYTHMNLPPGSTRTYRVAAINSQGTGVYSRRASATTSATVPDAPSGLTATASGQNRINLSWRAPLRDGGARITGYRIEISPTGTSSWTELVSNTASFANTYIHRGLAPATTWYYRVSAINSVGHGLPSNVESATTDATVPGAPTRLSATASGQNQIDLSWVAPTYDGGAPITGYRIESSTNGMTFTPLRSNTNSPATTFPHTGLAPASKRFYRVYAINSAGRSPASNIANATTDATVPAAPTNLSATANGTSQIDLSWQAPSFDGGARITGYRIDVADSGSGPWAALVANTRSSSTSYPHTGLAPASTRYYRVSAINSVGRSPESGVANATTDATVPDAPTGLMATATEPTRIDLVWTAPAYDGGAPVSSYRIEISEDGAAWRDLLASTGVTSTAYAHTGLMPGSMRHYRVSAINVAGTGVPSNIASATTDDPIDRAGRVNAEVLSHAAAAMTSSTLSAISGRVESFAASDPFGRQIQMGALSSLGAASAPQPGMYGRGNGGFGAGTDLDARRLLDGASFLMPLGDAPQLGGSNPALATWGSGEYRNMSRPRGGLVDWEGEMLNLHAGADIRLRPHILAGLVATRSTGDFDFTDKTGETDVAGTYASRMISINPYVAGFLGRVDITGWATGGYGWGTVEIEDERKELRSSRVSITNGGAGAAGDLLASGSAVLRVKAEGWLARVDVEGDAEIEQVTLDMRRARVALEWKQGYQFTSGHEVAVLLEGGMRYDDGDASNGAGMEFGGGLRYVSPRGGLTVEGRGRVLATGDVGYEEWGVSGLIVFDSHGRGEGLSVRLVPTWGQASSGVQALWDQGVSALPRGDFDSARGRLDAEVEYGLRNFAGKPYGRAYLVDGGGRAFGSGIRYEITRVVDLRVEATRRQSTFAPARHGLTMRGRWKF